MRDDLKKKMYCPQIANEAGEPLDVSDKTAQKVKVNWAAKVDKELALDKCLPSVKAPTLVTGECVWKIIALLIC